jgi:DNA-3-methyladenine glycosylase II
LKLTLETINDGLKHLRAADPVMENLIDRVGAFGLRPRRDRFRMLVRAIISQQISTHAARSIRRRLEKLVAPENITAETLARFKPAELRTAGLSSQKAAYLLDLSRKITTGQMRLGQLHRLSDDEVIEQLIQVNGIGVWTAQMFLIFSLGRMDIFPHADLGIRAALRNLYELDELPDKITSHKIAEPWRPFATIASWYCWRSHELK